MPQLISRTCVQNITQAPSTPPPAPTPIGCKFLKSKPAAKAVGQRGGIIQCQRSRSSELQEYLGNDVAHRRTNDRDHCAQTTVMRANLRLPTCTTATVPFA